MRLFENWKKALDENFQIDAALMDLSKSFDCIRHDLAKRYAYGLSKETTTSVKSKNRRHLKLSANCNIWSTSRVYPRSILFIIFLIDLLEVLKNFDIYNFTDDNAISVASRNRDTLLETLKNESKSALTWFRNNNIILNPDKIQIMLLQQSVQQVIQEILQNDSNEIEPENSVTLLGITIDNRLSFDDHILKLCDKASIQLNAIFTLRKYMGQKELKVALNSFIYSNFHYCPFA